MDSATWEDTLREIDSFFDKEEDVNTKQQDRTPRPQLLPTTAAPWDTILCCSKLKAVPDDPRSMSKPATQQSKKHFDFLLLQGSQVARKDDPDLALTRKHYGEGILSVVRMGEVADSVWPTKYFAAWATQDSILGGFVEIDGRKVKAAQSQTIEGFRSAQIHQYFGECPDHPNLEYFVRFHPLIPTAAASPVKKTNKKCEGKAINDQRRAASLSTYDGVRLQAEVKQRLQVGKNERLQVGTSERPQSGMNERLKAKDVARLEELQFANAKALGLWFYDNEDIGDAVKLDDEAFPTMTLASEDGDDKPSESLKETIKQAGVFTQRDFNLSGLSFGHIDLHPLISAQKQAVRLGPPDAQYGVMQESNPPWYRDTLYDTLMG